MEPPPNASDAFDDRWRIEEKKLKKQTQM